MFVDFLNSHQRLLFSVSGAERGAETRHSIKSHPFGLLWKDQKSRVQQHRVKQITHKLVYAAERRYAHVLPIIKGFIHLISYKLKETK